MSKQSSTSFLLLRAVLAVLLMIGFYLLALTIAGLLAWVPIAELKYAHRLHIKLAAICVISALVILWSILPRFDKFQAPGPRLDSSGSPKLFDLLNHIASKTGQAAPSEVYLIPDVNAWVAQRGGIMGFGSRRVMGVGLPLLQVFNVSEFAAVLAHEFGHYYGGDTRLGPWIYKTRAMIGRTLSGLGDSIIQAPFLWYGKLYLRITHAISRRQEFLADEVAARTVSPGALVSGLKKVHGAALGFHSYLQHEFAPVLNAGMKSPFLEGFSRYCASEKIKDALSKSIALELAEGKSDSYDTHPALKDRIAALDRLDLQSASEDTTPALSLLGNYQSYETELIRALTGSDKINDLPSVTWEEVGAKAYLPLWRKTVEANLASITGKVVEDIYTLAANPEAFVKQIAPETTVDSEEARQATVGILGCCLAVALADSGWAVESNLGDAIRLQKDGRTVEPFSILADIAGGKMEKAEWNEKFGDLNRVALAARNAA